MAPRSYKHVACSEDEVPFYLHLMKTLGSGSSGTVYHARKRIDGEEVACKVIKKRDNNVARVRREISVHSRLSHDHIVQLQEVYESPEKLYLVMELGRGSSLIDVVCKQFPNGVPEEATAKIFYHVCKALMYMHDKGLVHRDVKPDNIVIFADSELSATSHLHVTAKLCDFGAALRPEEQTNWSTVCAANRPKRAGTLQYVAPEVVIHRPHSAASDMWSVGVSLYVALCGRMPFFGASTKEMLEHICTGRFHLPGVLFDHVGDQAKDFLKKLLRVRRRDRLTAAQALAHPFLASHCTESTAATVLSAPLLHTSSRQTALDSLKVLHIGSPYSKTRNEEGLCASPLTPLGDALPSPSAETNWCTEMSAGDLAAQAADDCTAMRSAASVD